MATGSPFRWTSAAISHVGLVREINEDTCLNEPERGLWAVADGMGGYTHGDLASHSVIAALSQLPPSIGLAEAGRTARAWLQEVNRQLCVEAARRGGQVIGSTVVVLYARERQCGCLWAGDSRIYRYRNGQLTQITRDHSQVGELLSQGLLTPAEAAVHPLRHLITRAVGAAETLDLDEEFLEVEDEDMFLLCSDGLSNEVSQEEMRAALAGGSCEQASKVLIDLALGHGGRDNVSLIVVRAEDVLNMDETVLNPAVS